MNHFQAKPMPARAVPFLGAAVSVCVAFAMLAVLLAVALQGVGLVEWGLQ